MTFEFVRTEPGADSIVVEVARVVPNLKRLGLISPRVRQAFGELGIIQFEDVDPDEQDRQLGFI